MQTTHSSVSLLYKTSAQIQTGSDKLNLTMTVAVKKLVAVSTASKKQANVSKARGTQSRSCAILLYRLYSHPEGACRDEHALLASPYFVQSLHPLLSMLKYTSVQSRTSVGYNGSVPMYYIL